MRSNDIMHFVPKVIDTLGSHPANKGFPWL